MRIFAKTLIQRTNFIYKIPANPLNPFNPRSKKNCESLRNLTTNQKHEESQRKCKFSAKTFANLCENFSIKKEFHIQNPRQSVKSVQSAFQKKLQIFSNFYHKDTQSKNRKNHKENLSSLRKPLRISAKTLIQRTNFIYKIRANPLNPRSKKNTANLLLFQKTQFYFHFKVSISVCISFLI